MGPDDDAGAPGAAVTLELCGSWEHRPPCPLAPHHTQPERNGETVVLRVVFATEPENEPEVRRRIDRALDGGSVTGPDGRTSHWDFLDGRAAVPSDSEAAQARRIAGT
jgi:hypothetical protein